MRLRNRIGAGFAVALAIVLAIAAMSWVGAVDLVATTHATDRNHAVVRALDHVLGDLDDIETGERGYLLTGARDFLEPYARGRRALPADLAALGSQVDGDPVQRAGAARLAELAQRKLAHSSQIVALTDQHNAAAASLLVASRAGKSLMDDAQRAAADLRAHTDAALGTTIAQARARARFGLWLIGASVGGMLLLVLAATLLLTRSITRPLAELAAAARRLGHGEPPGRVPTARRDEIGELARAVVDMAAQRQRAEAHTRELVELAADAFFCADLDGRYVDVNAAACQLLGYERDELLGKTIADLVPAEDLPRLAASRAALLASGYGQLSEWALRRKDGSRVPVEVNAKILPDGRWEAFVRDISERKRLEAEQARLYAELETAVRAREELLAVVSHDLKNPLHAIGLRAQLLERSPQPELRAQGTSIRRAVGRMQSMIRGLLDAASLDAGQLRLERDDHALLPLVEEIIDGVAPIAQDREVRVVCRVPEDLVVRVDRERIQQVLTNLLGNAVKFTPPGGTVTVAAERSSDGALVVYVSDTGAGIDAATLPRIFDRYFTTETGGRGTGLGLFIARALVEAHGGILSAKSEPGKGTTFAFTLPARDLDAGARP